MCPQNPEPLTPSKKPVLKECTLKNTTERANKGTLKNITLNQCKISPNSSFTLSKIRNFLFFFFFFWLRFDCSPLSSIPSQSSASSLTTLSQDPQSALQVCAIHANTSYHTECKAASRPTSNMPCVHVLSMLSFVRDDNR